MVILEKEGADGMSGEEAAWGEEQSQPGYSRRGEAGTRSLRWVSSVTHLAPNMASDGGTRRRDAGGCVVLSDELWRLDMNLKHPEAPGEELSEALV